MKKYLIHFIKLLRRNSITLLFRERKNK